MPANLLIAWYNSPHTKLQKEVTTKVLVLINQPYRNNKKKKDFIRCGKIRGVCCVYLQ